MTIRLEKTNGTTYANSRGVRLVIQSTVAVDTEAEALEAKRAFELVLAPRFTRDEAIALCVPLCAPGRTNQPDVAIRMGVRMTLEALAAAGVFSDGCDCEGRMGECPDTMARKLDAAGIR